MTPSSWQRPSPSSRWMALCRFGRTHRGVAGGRCDVEHQVSDVGIAARQDSKLRSSCDGFTDQRRQACDQRPYLSPDNFRAYSPQTAGDNRLQPDTPASSSRPRRRTTTSSPTPQTRAIVVEIACQPNPPSAEGRGLRLLLDRDAVLGPCRLRPKEMSGREPLGPHGRCRCLRATTSC
jgi:hypothetical protein